LAVWHISVLPLSQKGGYQVPQLNFMLVSSFKELGENIKDWLYDFFNPKLEGYTNFDFGEGDMINIRMIIFGIFAGVLLASLYAIYVKNVIGAFVRKLLAEGCLAQEKAMTLEELGFNKNIFVKQALRGSLLASTVIHVKPEPKEGEEGAEAEKYYIKEERKYAAEMRFNARGSGWPTFFFVLLCSVIAIFIIFAALPHVIDFLDNTISIFSVEGNTLK
jgi:hypothetical protein